MSPRPAPSARLRARPAACGLLLGGALLWTGPAVADTDVGPPDSVGVGGASRADLGSLGAVVSAPSTLALSARYEVQGGAVLGPDKRAGARVYALDSNTGPVALGLAYHYDHSVPATTDADLPGWVAPGDDLSNEEARTLILGGVATSFADRRVGVGASFGWAQRITRFTDKEPWFTAGVSVSGAAGPDQQLVVTGAVENLVDPDNPYAPLTFGTGAAWRPLPAFGILGQVDVVTGAFDGPADVGFGGGLEGVAAQVVALRGGFRRSVPRASDLATMGVGVMSESVSLDYAAELVVGHPGEIPAGWDDDRFRSFHHVALTLSF